MSETEFEKSFTSQGYKLKGSLLLPANSNNKKQAVLFINGSFPQTRDGAIDNSFTDWFPKPLPYRPIFKQEANLLAQSRITSFRYDKRGCGQSEGNFAQTDFFDLLNDAKQAYKWLSQQPEIKDKQLGIIGQSEGAVIALILASKMPKIPFIIIQGGFWDNLEIIFRWQAKINKENKISLNQLKKYYPMLYWINLQAEKIITAAKNNQQFIKLGDDNWSINFYLSWFKQHFDNPPNKFTKKINCPTLILHGECDHNVPPEQAHKIHNDIGGHSELHIFKNLEHGFRHMPKMNEDLIDDKEFDFEPIVTDTIIKWLKNI